MIQPIYINALVNSVSERNRKIKFEPNSLDLFNVSELFRVFNQAKVEINGDNIKALELATNLMLDNFEQSENFVAINNDYWCNKIYFNLFLKACSPLYADGVNEIEHNGATTYRDIAIALSKQYSVYCPCGNDREAYVAYCIFCLSEIFKKLDSIYDFVIAHLLHFDKLSDSANLTPEMSSQFVDKCWQISFQSISSMLEEQNKTDPSYHDVDSFYIRYRNVIGVIKEGTEHLAESLQPQRPQPPEKPAKYGFLNHLFRGK
ncbi:hypothetical protein [Citrobacter enshiensis]|uniref:hypothetical protein n=1 Tax=Citrobacter enshiensis TaxID=2971264 RepID=UPI0023E7CD56|nr:hypothetical protein [Citrobacter enshiensis]WET42169.1 hypothetical protein P2W74_08135 [Citrobacter enshiensis]